MYTDNAVNKDVLVIGFAPAYVTEDLTESADFYQAGGTIDRNETTAKTLDGHYVTISGSANLRFTNAASVGSGDTAYAAVYSRTDSGSWTFIDGAIVTIVSTGSTSYVTLAFPNKIAGPFTGSVKFKIICGVTGPDTGHTAKVDDTRLQVIAGIVK